MQTERWLEHNAPGYKELRLEEKHCIKTFSLIWSLFEAQVLGNSANAGAIIAKCKELDAGGALREKDFADSLIYFQERYTENGNLSDRFQYLHFRKNDHRKLVENVLLGVNSSPAEKLAACLIITYRYRNNYFHGYKWAYEFRGQLENFEQSSRLLTYTAELARQAPSAGRGKI